MFVESAGEFLVSCLCAQWCGTCREYRPGFDSLATKFPGVAFRWVDIEDEPEIAGDLDVENFPTLVIQRGHDVLFCGPMLPMRHLLERLLETFLAQTAEESAQYARGNAERLGWQGLADIRARLPE
ncbi:MAG: thiol reductase thioredoxin [Candidatus Dactylopiibacterium carminicum]|uniref:Thiol reductase thioredoxin n=1 Tax=Candidatus Dactylopiibacterium carminicum TaxID=857335 RepID=A0A272ESB3_9RHOO|nr:thiol reductase thioredoxin [Candidatus Dactylopiibacterium carminicum]PAS92936.1 MAG: thiol reductase thioredoxin [Candidatus Dactylopiibacterium carminicum]PAS96587.1 MAG: thiol reductase thioredoxin [Candidatus Dactylopiibacterium carminicum]PAS99009.1 MAG: thiol reductase thioredoxin [Candidatus Dactylopiibacterium carminicum]